MCTSGKLIFKGWAKIAYFAVGELLEMWHQARVQGFLLDLICLATAINGNQIGRLKDMKAGRLCQTHEECKEVLRLSHFAGCNLQKIISYPTFFVGKLCYN